MDSSRIRRERMVRQLEGAGIRDRRVLEAMLGVPRHEFVEEALQRNAYGDAALPIGGKQTISHPWIVARMCELALPDGSGRALEIGTGSGYHAAVLSRLFEQVYSLERIAELSRSARQRLRELQVENVHFKIFDGTYGWREFAPFRAILVTAGSPDVPAPLFEQLEEGGRLVIPLARGAKGEEQTLVRLTKCKGEPVREEFGDCSFVPLVGKFGWERVTPSIPSLAARGALGGVLMGLANLVPGISGGTMLLAAGVYPRFINAVAEVSTLRFRYRSLVVLVSVAVAAAAGILLLAGVLKDLVVDYRWVMYSLFIGLTLGGLPVVYRLARPLTSAAIVAAGGSFLAMVTLAVLQATGVVGAGGSNLFMLFVAGLAGASAMILPGLSGGYILLLLGQYVPILSAIESFKLALEERDLAAAMDPAMTVMLPVGVGLVVGIVGVSNLLKWLLERHRKATLGVLIGLLLGSVVGLWPYQHSVEPVPGSTVIKGTPVTAANLTEFDREDWPTDYFAPGASQVVSSLALIVLGFSVTLGIARIGGDDSIS